MGDIGDDQDQQWVPPVQVAWDDRTDQWVPQGDYMIGPDPDGGPKGSLLWSASSPRAVGEAFAWEARRRGVLVSWPTTVVAPAGPAARALTGRVYEAFERHEEESRDARLRKFAEWIVSLDDPKMAEQRREVSLTRIIAQAREALS